MSHVRQQLRQQVATLLATSGYTVFSSRKYVIDESELPCITVSTDGDKVDYLTEHAPAVQERTVPIRVDGYVKQIDNSDDALDDISVAVEKLLDALDNGEYAGCEISIGVLGNQPVGIVSMLYRIKVCTESDAPEVIL